MDEAEDLSLRQQAQYEALEVIAEHFGMWDQSSGSEGAHFMGEEHNPFVDDGLMCANCSFYCGGQKCMIVQGRIHPMGLCKLWIIHEELLEKGLQKSSYTPPEGVRAAARRALGWIAEGRAGDGFTATGRYRAQTLAAGDSVSLDTIRRMSSFLARHEVDKKAEGFSQGEKGYPSPGRVAWDAWGGDAGFSWAKSIVSQLEKGRFGSRSAAGTYAANIRWSRHTDGTGLSATEVVSRLAAGEKVGIRNDQVSGVMAEMLYSDAVDLSNLSVIGTPFFASSHPKVPRDQMPQTPSARKDEFLADVEARGLTVERRTVKPSELRASQSEMNSRSTAEIAARESAKGADAYKVGDSLAVVVSSDGFVVDGHHRWAGAALMQASGRQVEMSVIVIGAPRDALLGVIRDWNAQAGVPRRTFDERNAPAAVGKALAFYRACDLALDAQKDYANVSDT